MFKPHGQAVLLGGDISYADHYPFLDNVRLDAWGQFAEKSSPGFGLLAIKKLTLPLRLKSHNRTNHLLVQFM